MPQPAIMTPAPGERLLRFVGDRVRFTLRAGAERAGWRALLRTNLGRAAARRREIIAAHAGGAAAAGASWRDVPMQKTADGWEIELPLAEVGCFKAKAYLLDEKNWQHWPDGADVGISVHPNFARTANTIYCAFTRLFGATKNLPSAATKNSRRKSSRSTRKISPSSRRPANSATSRASCRTSSTARLPHPSSAARASDADDLRALRPFRQSVRRAGFDRGGSRARRIRQAHHRH
jgi:hypothetical protein